MPTKLTSLDREEFIGELERGLRDESDIYVVSSRTLYLQTINKWMPLFHLEVSPSGGELDEAVVEGNRSRHIDRQPGLPRLLDYREMAEIAINS